MSKLRSVSTAVWSDVWFEDLTPNQKLIWLYLITNEKTNMLGIYEASIKKIAFETGVNKTEVEKALSEFTKAGRVKYQHNHIILVKFLKHQNFNTNMKKSAIDVYLNLPKELIDSNLKLDKDKPKESFQTLSKHLGMVRKVEVEVEEEIEEEVQKEKERLENLKESFESFWNLYDKKKGKANALKEWLKLTDEEINLIFDHVPKLTRATEQQYRKDPERYLKHKAFLDEVIQKQAPTGFGVQNTAHNGNNTIFEDSL